MALHQQIISSIKWTAFGKAASQAISWVVTLYVIRILAPGDYGLMAMASVVIAFLSTFNEFGLGTALVQSKNIDDKHIGAVYGAMLLLGMVLSALLALAAPWIALFFDEPRLAPILSVAGLQFVLNAASVVPESMMQRSMQFKPLSLADLLGAATASLATLALALGGHGVWSLVLGNLAGVLVRLTVLIALNPRRVSPNGHFKAAATLLSFGSYVTAGRFVSYFMSQADVFIGAKLLGKDALGLYTVALQLASLPVNKAMSIVNQVAFSAISRLQDQQAQMQAGLTQALRWLAYLATPVVYGLACVAPDFVPLVLGPQWTDAVLPLHLVALVMPLRMIGALFSTAVNALGRADIGFKNTLTGAAILPLCFWVGVQWGAPGLAGAWVVGVPTVLLINFRQTSRVIGLTARQVVQAVAVPFACAGVMAMVLLVARGFITQQQPTWTGLVAQIVIGALVYTGTALLLDAQLRTKAVQLFNTVRALR